MYLGKALTAVLVQPDRVDFTSFWKAALAPRTELDPQPSRRRRKKKTKLKASVRGKETHEASSFF